MALVGTTGLAGTAAAAGRSGSFTPTITSATRLDPAAETVTLPLLEGTHGGQKIYYVVTDDSDKQDAARRGVNWAPKLANALGGTGTAVQKASIVGGVVEFPGIVDHKAGHTVTMKTFFGFWNGRTARRRVHLELPDRRDGLRPAPDAGRGTAPAELRRGSSAGSVPGSRRPNARR